MKVFHFHKKKKIDTRQNSIKIMNQNGDVQWKF